jgi:hypothetical protein
VAILLLVSIELNHATIRRKIKIGGDDYNSGDACSSFESASTIDLARFIIVVVDAAASNVPNLSRGVVSTTAMAS